ncbi:MAG: YfhO family protein [Bacilli bacterium]|jgi:putative flippase GtrA|nr:YfhO family protein [Bacilli bacterium]
MEYFLKRHKQVIIETLLFLLFIILFLFILRLMDITIGRNGGDFQAQHIRFVDYLRNNFWQTHDLFPQISMNYGGGQNFANLYYHGMYNPLILLSYLFPFINTLGWFSIMDIILLISTFLGMNILLRKYHIKRMIILIISTLTALSPCLITHLAWHPMFIYYYPLMIFSLISIHYLINNKTMWHFIILVALIFYTNFFFALIIGFMQLIFFISNIHFYYKFSFNEKLVLYRKLIFSYLIGILIGMFIFIPQVNVLLNSDRSINSIKEIGLLYFRSILSISVDTYSMGLGILGIFTLILALFNYKNKFNLVIALSIIIVLVLQPLIYLLNLFAYVNVKVFIYMVPLIFFILALQLNDDRLKCKKIALILAIIFTIISIIKVYSLNEVNVASNFMTKFNINFLVIYVLFQLTLLVLLLSKKLIKKRNLIIINFFLVIIFTIIYSCHFLSIKEYQKQVLPNNIKNSILKQLENSNDFYYTNLTNNFINDIDIFSPTFYSSTENNNFVNFYNHYLDLEKTSFQRVVSENVIDNYLMTNFLGVKNQYSNNKINEYYPSHSFIYGVSNDNVYNIKYLDKLDSFKRIIALNEGFFSDDTNKEFKYQDIEMKQIYQSNKRINVKKGYKFNYSIPSQYQRKGIFIIRSKVINNKIDKGYMKVNNHRTVIKPFNKAYNESEVNKALIIIDNDGSEKNLKFEFNKQDNIYQGLDIKFIDYQDIVNNQFKVYYPTNINNKFNHSYSFTINMKKDGYLATSLFYDDGFTIYDNNKQLNIKKVNKYFLGAKLSQKEHKIIISYHIPYFKVGLSLSIIGIFILGLIIVNEVKIFNKSFFRFMIVGAFNTINYYFAYLLLLNFLPYLLAHVLGFIYSAFVSYFLTSIYTFKRKPTLKTFIAFPLTFLPNLLLSSVGTTLIVEIGLLSKSIASLVVMILIIPITYLINRLIFKKNK